jgi:integrase
MSVANVVKLEVRRAKPAPAIKVPKKISDTWIRNLKSPASGKQKVGVDDNLILELRNGGKYWNVRYTLNGNRADMRVGTYPKVSFVEAKAERDEIVKNAAAGICPRSAKKIERINDHSRLAAEAAEVKSAGNPMPTFKEVAERWIRKQSKGWTLKQTSNVKGRMSNHVYAHIGHLAIDAVTMTEVIVLAELLEPKSKGEKGKFETRDKCLDYIRNVFEYAPFVCDRYDASRPNPAKFSRVSALAKRDDVNAKEKYQALDFKALPGLLVDLDKHQGNANHSGRGSGQSGFSPLVKICLKLQVLTLLRPSEVRKGEWSEIDFEERSWTIPKERMKMREAHYVPLSDQMIALLKELHAITGEFKIMFPGMINKRTAFDPNKYMSDAVVNKAIRTLGYAATAHGFRHMGSTYLNAQEKGEEGEEERMWDRLWIEYSLAHKDPNEMAGHYDNNKYLKGRRRMMQWYSDQIMSRLG